MYKDRIRTKYPYPNRKNVTIEVGHSLFREDCPEITQTEDKYSKIESTVLDVGSYTGSESLHFGVVVSTYHRESDRMISKHGGVSIPYSDIETMEVLRDTIDKAIADAKEWQSKQEGVDGS